jgi:hypothetical protein
VQLVVSSGDVEGHEGLGQPGKRTAAGIKPGPLLSANCTIKAGTLHGDVDDLELIALPHQFCRWADNLLS